MSEQSKQPELMQWLLAGAGMEADPAAITKDEKEGFLYLPIAHVEAQLDEIFFGLWQTSNFRWQVVANEIIGSIDLEVYNPVAGCWLKRTGAASVPVQQRSGSAPSDVDAKYKNALVKDFPHLKADCIKNAAKSLGRRFGRDLNRKYDEMIEDRTEEIEVADALMGDLKKMLADIETVDQLRDMLRENQHYLKNDITKSEIMRRRKELTTPENGANKQLPSGGKKL